MPDGEPTIEEVIFRNFQGWEPHNIPPTDLLPRLVGEGQLIDARGVVTDADGVIRWRRDQFTLPATGKTLLDIFEYKTGSYNQLLAFCTDSKLYKLETPWSTAAGTQFAYGYQLNFDDPGNGNYAFGEAATSLQASGRYGFAAARDILMVGHRSQATKRWNGTALTDVGILPPADTVGTAINFEGAGWSETDTGGYLVRATTKITTTVMPVTADSRVSRDYGAAYFGDYHHQFQVRITAATASARCIVWAVTNTADETHANWVDYQAVTAARGATGIYGLGLYDSDAAGGAGAVHSVYPLTVDTTYYCRVRREGSTTTLKVYSDSAYTTLVGESEWFDCIEDTFQYLYGAAAFEDAGAFTISGWVDQMAEASLFAGDASNAGLLPAGTYSYYYTYGNSEWESMPSNIIDVVAAADKRVDLSGIDVGGATVTWRRIYRAFTTAVTAGARGETFGLLVELAAQDEGGSDVTTYTDNILPAHVGEPIAFDHAIPPRGDLLIHHNDRVFMAHCSSTSQSYDDYETTGLDNMLFWSELDDPFYFPGQNYVRVGDSSRIMALVSWRGWLFIFKETSVWVMRGYTEDQFILEQLTGEFGISNYNAAASGPPGVVWRDKGGLMFTDGTNVRVLRDYDVMSLDPPASTVTHPTIAYHRQKFYILEGDYLLTWDPVRDSWAYEGFNETTVGIRAFNFGRWQSHLLSYWIWDGTNSYLGIKDTGQQFTYYDAEGSDSTAELFAPVQITLPALIARPGEEIVPLEIWIDGSWLNHVTPGFRPYLYLNNDAEYSSVAGHNAWETTPRAAKDGEMIGVPSGYFYDTTGKTNAFQVLYIQIKATDVEEFELRAVGLRFYRRPARG